MRYDAIAPPAAVGVPPIPGGPQAPGAVAAARGGDRAATGELLTEAGGAAERLGGEAVTGALAMDPLRLPALRRRSTRSPGTGPRRCWTSPALLAERS
jgi:hypothetical protein